jgi:hypothetical protein
MFFRSNSTEFLFNVLKMVFSQFKIIFKESVYFSQVFHLYGSGYFRLYLQKKVKNFLKNQTKNKNELLKD